MPGGTTGAAARREVLAFDPVRNAVRRLASLPGALTHAAGAALGGSFYVIGGRTTATGGQTAQVLAVDPATGTVHPAGSLPHPLSDAAAVADGGRILVIGGRDAAGRVSDEIVELKPAR